MTDPRPGDRVRATVEATVAVVDKMGVVMYTGASINPTRVCARTGENWSFEVIRREIEVGDVIYRDDVAARDWADGTVVRATRPTVHSPIHRAGGAWWYGSRQVNPYDFSPNVEFEVLAVGV